MRLLVVGSTQRGKTTLIKQIIKGIQKKNKVDMTIILTDYSEEFLELEKKNHFISIFPKD